MPKTSAPALVLLVGFVPALVSTALAQDGATTAAHGEGASEAGPIPLAQEAKDAIARFRVPEGFRVELFASEPLLANPVAFCFDVFGRAYVAETFRHSQGVTDMREHMDWLEDDLAIRTVADRVAMFRKHEGDDGLARGYAIETDRVTRVVDQDGDGVADSGSVFADGFTDPAVGIGAGVLARPLDGAGGTELWFTCIPDVWRLFDADDDGAAESRVSQSEGYGLRVALLGHDLHGLVVGPDGRMYFSVGDRGFNVKTAEGAELVRFGTGAVFRCELDGSGLELFCDGLRNPQELVFDEQGNLFTLDNNSDGGDQARWTWLLRGSDTGWRQAYQWVREPTSRGPWNAELMWKPFHKEQPAFILPPIANFTSGPSGLTIYPGTGFGEEWRGKFFVCDFRGNPGYSGIYAFDHGPDRAGFKLGETQEFVWDALPTDVTFGVDGNLYWSDWLTGWNRTGKGRLYRVVPGDRTAEETVAIAETLDLLQQLAAEGGAGSGSEAGRQSALGQASGLTDEEVTELFSHRDLRVRQEAQLAIAHRALAEPDHVEGHRHLVPVLQRLRTPATNERERTARLHALWAVWHVSRRSSALGAVLPKHVTGLLYDSDVEMVAQACRVFGDLSWQPAGRRVPQLLIHESPRVRLYAAEALGGIGMAETSTGALIELLELTAATDPWLRHAAIHAIERIGNPGDVHAQLSHPMEHVRRAMAVVLRRWGDDVVAVLLDDASALVRAEAARAIYDSRIPDAMDDLAVFLGTAPEEATASLTWRRAVHACREVGSGPAALALADFAVSKRGPVSVRAEAIRALARWALPLTRDGILMDHRPVAAGEPQHVEALLGHSLFSAGFASRLGSASTIESQGAVDALAKALVELHEAWRSPALEPAIFAVADSVGLGAAARRAALSVLVSVAPESGETQALVDAALDDVGSPLRAQAFATLGDADAAERLLMAGGEGPLADRAEAVRILGSLEGARSVAAFGSLGLELRESSDATLVEWLEAAEASSIESLREMAAEFQSSWVDARAAGEPMAGWLMCLDGGDPGQGAKVFSSKAETSCTKCHIVGGAGGSEAGPQLDAVADRLDARSLLHSVVEPNAAIAEGFQSWILLADGEPFAGRIIEETMDLIVLETSKKEQLEFHPEEIEARKRDVSAMPGDIARHLSRREMRDLVAYLRGLKQEITAPR